MIPPVNSYSLFNKTLNDDILFTLSQIMGKNLSNGRLTLLLKVTKSTWVCRVLNLRSVTYKITCPSSFNSGFSFLAFHLVFQCFINNLDNWNAEGLKWKVTFIHKLYTYFQPCFQVQYPPPETLKYIPTFMLVKAIFNNVWIQIHILSAYMHTHTSHHLKTSTFC